MARGKHAVVRELRRGRTFVVLTVLAMLMALFVAVPGVGVEGYSIGDRVWYDQDQDGIQDPSEPGYNGATVHLYDNATCSGSPMASTTTGATGFDGFYEFTDLLAGDYCLQFGDIPAGWSISPADQGADDTIDSDTNGSAQIPNISLSTDDPTEDMGVYVSGSLGDSVSCLSTGSGLANITVTLFEDFDGDGVADGSAIATTETDAAGFYQFTGMEVGLAGDSSNLTQYILAVDTADPDLGTCNVPVSPTKYNPPLESDSPGDADNDFIFEEANYPPLANDDAYSTDEDTPLNVGAPGVLANDSDADGDPLAAVLITNVSNGVLILDPGGAFQYTPDVDFCGSDTFTYVANDGTADSNIGTVTLTVNCVNDPPVADPNGPYSGVAGEAIVFDGTGSSDPEGDPLTFSWDWGDGSPLYGGATPTHVYEPGTFTLCLTVTDPGGLSDTACTTAVVIEPVPIDIDPSSCPNPFNVGARGVLPVAILGTEDFEVAQVDPASVRLEGVAPLRWSWEDVATPFEPYLGKFDAYDCTECGPDGYEDLSFKFKAQEVALALGDVNDGDVLVLTLTGNLKPEFGGTEFIGEDVTLILSR